MPSPDRDDEVVLIEMFAKTHKVASRHRAHGDHRGPRARAARGRHRHVPRVRAVGAQRRASASPERFAVLWMTRKAVEAAYDMRGAFNSVVMKLSPGANPDARASNALDTLLDRYGWPGRLRARPSALELLPDAGHGAARGHGHHGADHLPRAWPPSC